MVSEKILIMVLLSQSVLSCTVITGTKLGTGPFCRQELGCRHGEPRQGVYRQGKRSPRCLRCQEGQTGTDKSSSKEGTVTSCISSSTVAICSFFLSQLEGKRPERLTRCSQAVLHPLEVQGLPASHRRQPGDNAGGFPQNSELCGSVT